MNDVTWSFFSLLPEWPENYIAYLLSFAGVLQKILEDPLVYILFYAQLEITNVPCKTHSA